MSCLHGNDCQQDRDETIVSFFFNARSPDKLVKSTEGMYRCLLHQILTQLPRLKRSLSHLQVPKEGEAWSTKQLENAFRIVILGLSANERTICFVDALDECKIEDVRRAIERFEDLAESVTSRNTPFRICFSSRYYPQITMLRHEELKLDLKSEHMIDIWRYIDNKLTVRKGAKQELSTKIYHRCSGIFLWVVLVVKRLREKSDTGSTRSQLLAILDSIPDELEDLFAKVVAEPDAALISVVQWTLFSNRKLSTPELYFAIQASIGGITKSSWNDEAIDLESMKRYLLHASRGLMEYPNATNSTRWFDQSHAILIFIHESVREYFLGGGLGSIDQASLHETNAVGHAKLAEGCMSYLELAFSQASVSTPRSAQMHYATLPLVEYASENVLRHTDVAFAAGVVDVGLLERFPLQHVTRFLDRERQVESEHTSCFLHLLIQQNCSALITALLKRQSRPLDLSNLVQHKQANAVSASTHTCPAKSRVRSGRGSLRSCPLRLAMSHDYKRVAKLLLEYGADVGMGGESWSRHLLLAVSEDHWFRRLGRLSRYDWVHILLEARAGTEAADDDDDGNTALIKATGSWDYQLVRVLLEKGANVCAQNHQHLTALHAAVNNENLDGGRDFHMLQTLLDAGADINASGGQYDTVLNAAFANRDPGLANFLIERGAIVTNARGREYRDRFLEDFQRFLTASQSDMRQASSVSDTGDTVVQFCFDHELQPIPSDNDFEGAERGEDEFSLVTPIYDAPRFFGTLTGS